MKMGLHFIVNYFTAFPSCAEKNETILVVDVLFQAVLIDMCIDSTDLTSKQHALWFLTSWNINFFVCHHPIS